MVKEMMLRDCRNQEIMENLRITRDMLLGDVRAIYKMHGVRKRENGGRRELAEKLGVVFVSKRDEFLKRVKEMREKGMKWREITRELGAPEGRMNSWREGVRRIGIQQDAGHNIAAVADLVSAPPTAKQARGDSA